MKIKIQKRFYGEMDNTEQDKLKASPYFIVIQKTEDKEIKIPCSNEAVARNVLASYSNYKSKSKTSLMRD